MWFVSFARSQAMYSKVAGDDEESIRKPKTPEDDVSEETTSRSIGFYYSFLIGKLLLAASYVCLVYLVLRQKGDLCILGNERIFEDAPVIYESIRFQRAGFHDPRHSATTKYEGAPSRENEAAWTHLLDVGVVSISQRENSRIINGSASSNNNPEQHIVELEIDQFWALNDARTGHPFNNFSQREDHTDHCIDYLRQVIMCHGDLTPITFEWITEIKGYIAHHSTPHTCRAFEPIYNWAQERKTPGMMTDGMHQNVELKQPESFD